MKSYTDLSQSKKLAEFLPLESTDMGWYYSSNPNAARNQMWVGTKVKNADIPCWSLAALLDYLSANFRVDIKYLDNYWELNCRVQVTYNKELVDACYEAIVFLHEQKLL